MNLKNKSLSETIGILDSSTSLELQESLVIQPLAFDYSDNKIFLGDEQFGYITFKKSLWDLVYSFHIDAYFDKQDVYDYINQKYRATGIWESYYIGAVSQVKTLLLNLELNPDLINSDISTLVIETDREHHLNKMKIPTHNIVPFKEYLIKSIEYVNSKGFDFSLDF